MVKTEEKNKTEKKQESKVFAVLETGGKQYKVSEGDIITIEKMEGDYKEGDEIGFDTVLMVDDGNRAKIGDPYVKGSKVKAKFLEEGRAKKISVTRYRSKSRYFKNKGHRQPYNKIKIVSVS